MGRGFLSLPALSVKNGLDVVEGVYVVIRVTCLVNRRLRPTRATVEHIRGLSLTQPEWDRGWGARGWADCRPSCATVECFEYLVGVRGKDM